VNINCFPQAGTVVLEALYKSRPATLGDPRVGDRACSDSFTKRSRDEKEAEDIHYANTLQESEPLDSALSM
jgi:hypothetical protein